MGFQWGLFQVKMVSLFYDAAYMLCGLAAIVIGAKIKSQADLSPEAGTNGIGTALVIFGCVIFVVSIVGSFAVIKDNRKALMTFGVSLGILIVLKLLLASVVLYYLSDATKASKQRVVDIFNEGPDRIREIENIQRGYECCGLETGYHHWASSAEGLIPPSCCPTDDVPCTVENVFTAICTEKVGASVEGIGTVISLTLFSIAFFEVAGLILSVCLNNTWNNEKRRDEEYAPSAPNL